MQCMAMRGSMNRGRLARCETDAFLVRAWMMTRMIGPSFQFVAESFSHPGSVTALTAIYSFAYATMGIMQALTVH